MRVWTSWAAAVSPSADAKLTTTGVLRSVVTAAGVETVGRSYTGVTSMCTVDGNDL